MQTEPLLMKFAVERSPAVSLPGHYEADRQVWMIETQDGHVPLVEADDQSAPVAELVTKTNAQAERDDPSPQDILGLTTKTAHQLERDDVDPRQLMLELITVTKIGSERPDI